MATSFTYHKAARTKLRRFPILPRIGFTLDVAGRQFTFKTVPLIETFLNWRELGFTVANFKKVASDELSEISFPKEKGQTIASIKNLRPKNINVKKTGTKGQ